MAVPGVNTPPFTMKFPPTSNAFVPSESVPPNREKLPVDVVLTDGVTVPPDLSIVRAAKLVELTLCAAAPFSTVSPVPE